MTYALQHMDLLTYLAEEDYILMNYSKGIIHNLLSDE